MIHCICLRGGMDNTVVVSPSFNCMFKWWLKGQKWHPNIKTPELAAQGRTKSCFSSTTVGKERIRVCTPVSCPTQIMTRLQPCTVPLQTNIWRCIPCFYIRPGHYSQSICVPLCIAPSFFSSVSLSGFKTWPGCMCVHGAGRVLCYWAAQCDSTATSLTHSWVWSRPVNPEEKQANRSVSALLFHWMCGRLTWNATF